MAAEGELTFGEVIQGTFDVFGKNIRPIAIYVVIFSIIGTFFEWGVPLVITQDSVVDALSDTALLGAFGTVAIVTGLLIFIAAVVAQYMLWAAILQSEGLGHNPASGRYLAFFGQSILVALGSGLALLLLVLPMFFVLARWSMAPALLIGNNRGAVEALGDSWDAVRGNTTPVFLAILVGALGIALVGGVAGGVDAFTDGTGSIISLFSIALAQIISNLGTCLMVALGVFLFGYFYGNTDALQDVFG